MARTQQLMAMSQALSQQESDQHVFLATQQFRKLLSVETNPPIQEARRGDAAAPRALPA